MVVEIARLGKLTMMLKVTLDDLPFASVTVTVTLTELVGSVATAGVLAARRSAAWAIMPSGCIIPEIVAEVVSALTIKLSPLGRPVEDQVKGLLPFETEIGHE